MLKKAVFLGAIILIGIALASCTGNQNIANPFPYGDESMVDPSVIHANVNDFTYVPVDLSPYLPWDAYPYVPWDDLAYIPWDIYPYFTWHDFAYLPHDVLVHFPWDELAYFPGDGANYGPSDEFPYGDLGFELPPLHWVFKDIGCPNSRQVAISIAASQRYLFTPDLGPNVDVSDCNSTYKCYPIEGKPGWLYCVANKEKYSSKNCPIKICVQLGKELSCQELDPGVSIDCPSQQPTPTNVPPFCPTLNDAVSCRLHANDGCVWNSLVKPARCEGP